MSSIKIRVERRDCEQEFIPCQQMKSVSYEIKLVVWWICLTILFRFIANVVHDIMSTNEKKVINRD